MKEVRDSILRAIDFAHAQPTQPAPSLRQTELPVLVRHQPHDRRCDDEAMETTLGILGLVIAMIALYREWSSGSEILLYDIRDLLDEQIKLLAQIRDRIK